MWARISGGTRRVFAVFFFLLICVFYLVIASTYSLIVNAVIPVCVLLFLIATSALSGPVDRLSPRTFRLLFLALLALAFAGSFYLAYKMRIHLPGDTDIIFSSVSDVLRDGRLNEVNPSIDATHYPHLTLYTNNDYFCRYPNNIGLLVLYIALYSLGGANNIPANTMTGHMPAIGATAFAVAVSALLVCLCVHLAYRKNSYTLFTLALYYAFVPFVFSIPNFYTDLWVIPFTLGGVYLYLRARYTPPERGVPLPFSALRAS